MLAGCFQNFPLKWTKYSTNSVNNTNKTSKPYLNHRKKCM